MNISLIVAMESEYALMHKLLGERDFACMGGNFISLSRCGLGKVNAAVMATELIRSNSPDLIVSSGVAGSCSPDVKTMDFVIGRRVAYHDVWCGEGNAPGQVQGLPVEFHAPEELCDRALSIPCSTGRVWSGLIASGDRFIETADEVTSVRRICPEALAVDMESGALAQTCYLKGVPFISIRLISDCEDTDRHTAYWDFWKTAAESSFQFVRQFLETL